MADGFLVAGHCYETSEEANDAFYSAVPPHIETSGTGYIVYTYQNYSGHQWTLNQQIHDSTGAVISDIDSPHSLSSVYGTCSLSESFFYMPSTADMKTAFEITFIPIMICYLVAYCLQSVVSMFEGP